MEIKQQLTGAEWNAEKGFYEWDGGRFSSKELLSQPVVKDLLEKYKEHKNPQVRRLVKILKKWDCDWMKQDELLWDIYEYIAEQDFKGEELDPSDIFDFYWDAWNYVMLGVRAREPEWRE